MLKQIVLSIKDLKNHLRPLVFGIPFFILLSAVILSLTDKDEFLKLATSMHGNLLTVFEPIYTFMTLFLIFLTVLIYFSPLGKLKLGGEVAKPYLTRFEWFSITLCTTIATGILFWGTAEPLYHFTGPPAFSGTEAGTTEALSFSLSTVFLHWSFTPYAIYTIPALIFALSFYNKKNPYSLYSLFLYSHETSPTELKAKKKVSIVDALALISLVLGMSASLGAGVLTLAGGINNFISFPSTPLNLFIIIAAIVIAFTISASTGILKGIKILSSINVAIFMMMAFTLLVLGPTSTIITQSFNALGEYVTQFFTRSTHMTITSGDQWPSSWTSFYWANWFAWAPVTAMFLGRIAYGRTVREFIWMNWIFPALFAIVWMSIFSGTTLWMEMNSPALLSGPLNETGPESVVYALYNQLSFAKLLIPIFLISVFISYVTSADSNTEAMASLSSQDQVKGMKNTSTSIKILWGTLIGLMSWVMVSFAGIDGIKMLSNLGGVPAVCLIGASAIYFCFKAKKYL